MIKDRLICILFLGVLSIGMASLLKMTSKVYRNASEPVFRCFSRIDQDRNGFICESELNMPRVYRKIDTDKDGIISMRELQRYYEIAFGGMPLTAARGL